MDSELEQFLSDDSAALGAEHTSSIVRDLLLFEYEGERYGLLAATVDAVVPWRRPAALPGAEMRVLGVIQDRGRIVVLIAHPVGRPTDGRGEGKRIIICNTGRGYVGVPASVTNTVAGVELQSEPTPLSIHDSPYGPFTFLEAERWAEEL